MKSFSDSITTFATKCAAVAIIASIPTSLLAMLWVGVVADDFCPAVERAQLERLEGKLMKSEASLKAAKRIAREAKFSCHDTSNRLLRHLWALSLVSVTATAAVTWKPTSSS